MTPHQQQEFFAKVKSEIEARKDLTKRDKAFLIQFFEGKTKLEAIQKLTDNYQLILSFIERMLESPAKIYPNSTIARMYKDIIKIRHQITFEFVANNTLNSFNSNFSNLI
jgi:hypothetical protein